MSNAWKMSLVLRSTFCVFAIPSVAYAGSQLGPIKYISADKTYGTGVVTIDNASDQPINKPSCASGSDKRWALNVGSNSAANQYIYSGALAAMASGWNVNIVGTGACSTVPWLEDIAYIEIRK